MARSVKFTQGLGLSLYTFGSSGDEGARVVLGAWAGVAFGLEDRRDGGGGGAEEDAEDGDGCADADEALALEEANRGREVV